jgi:hypothetical protein
MALKAQSGFSAQQTQVERNVPSTQSAGTRAERASWAFASEPQELCVSKRTSANVAESASHAQQFPPMASEVTVVSQAALAAGCCPVMLVQTQVLEVGHSQPVKGHLLA